MQVVSWREGVAEATAIHTGHTLRSISAQSKTDGVLNGTLQCEADTHNTHTVRAGSSRAVL